MNDDYLWSGGGTPDPDVARLEGLLRRFRHKPSTWSGGEQTPAPRKRRARVIIFSGLAAAALIAAIVGGWWFSRPSRDGWDVATLAGRPTIEGKGVSDRTRLSLGARLVTDATSRATLRIGLIGEAEIGPGSTVRLVRADAADNRLALERGTLSARIWAPPRLFFVETPSATAVDLGCAYTLEVDAGGAGLLRVTHGWVAFDNHGRESFVPEGAACRTRVGTGPGTPWYEDAHTPFTAALTRLDARPDDRQALTIVLAEARPRDALTLWHLLSKLGTDDRALVFDRLAVIVSLPASITREGIVAENREMLDAAWDALGLGVTSWWRLWKNPRPPDVSDARSHSALSRVLPPERPDPGRERRQDMSRRRFPFERILVAAVVAVAASSVFAGPPLICWKVETGGAASLPWIDRPNTYQGMDHDYKTSRLAGDTLFLLRASAPVLERMETLRRAALYAAGDAKAGEALLTGLVERTHENPSDALAWFDAGYFVEASRQAHGRNEPEFWSRFLEATGIRGNAAEGLGMKTGYDAIAKAIALGGDDPSMEYAAALVTWYPRRTEHDGHLRRATGGAAEGSLLAKNIRKNFDNH